MIQKKSFYPTMTITFLRIEEIIFFVFGLKSKEKPSIQSLNWNVNDSKNVFIFLLVYHRSSQGSSNCSNNGNDDDNDDHGDNQATKQPKTFWAFVVRWNEKYSTQKKQKLNSSLSSLASLPSFQTFPFHPCFLILFPPWCEFTQRFSCELS